MKNNLKRSLLWLGLAVAMVQSLPGYVYLSSQSSWLPGYIPMKAKVGITPVLSDGSHYSSSAQAGMQIWNGQLGAVQFYAQTEPVGGQVDYENDIYFDSTIEGDAFGSGVLAVTLIYTTPSIRQIFEADIIFNNAYTWDSYSGPLREAEDFRRVVTHELGHVLGLSHPDEQGQSVEALMNSHASDLDHLTADDITGAQSFYLAPGQNYPPGNNNFANATTITHSSGSLQVNGQSFYATKEAGEPDHDPGAGAGGASVWWKWTAPVNGNMTITTQYSHFDTLMGVYTGSAVDGLNALGTNDDVDPSVIRYSSVAFNAAAGTTYSIAVDGWDGESGIIVLNLAFTPEVVNVAPSFTSHPANQTVTVGLSAQFSIAASGTPAPSYRWQRLPAGTGTWVDLYDSSTYGGTGTTVLTVFSTQWAMSGDYFRCVATNMVGSVTSNPALLTLNPIAPVITMQPVSRTLEVGTVATFTAAASGTPVPGYRWQRMPNGSASWSDLNNGGAYAGVTSGMLTISSLTVAMNGDQFRCVATNAAGPVTTNAALLTVYVPLPVITVQPASQGLLLGTEAVLSVAATSPVTLGYQWQKEGVDLPSATAASHVIPSFQIGDVGDYRVIVSNSAGSVTSNVATLAVALAPNITAQPQPQGVYAGMAASFAVTVTSNAPMDYVWRKNGVPISGADQPVYAIPVVQLSDAGDYSVEVTNIAGTATSNPVSLAVTPSTAPVITLQPTHQGILEGMTVSFVIASTGAPTPDYQWQVIHPGGSVWGAPINGSVQYAGVQTDTLTITGATIAGNNGDLYRCVVSNVAGSITSNAVTLTVGLPGFTKLSAGRYHSLRLDLVSQPFVTGTNSSGQLGDGTTTNVTTAKPLTIPGQTIADIAAGAQHSLFLTSAGQVWTTGFNQTGQLGDGTNAAQSTPALLTTNAVGIAAAIFHSAVLKADGTLWTTGGNDSGQLGNGNTTDTNVLSQVATDVVELATGIRQSFYLKSDGTLWGMGDMNGSGVPVSTPVQIATNVKAVAAGGYHSLFLKTDGTLWTLGYNPFGQLGTGDTTDRTSPVQVAIGVKAIATGYFHSAFIKTDDSLWLMGYNSSGQLGDGTTTNRPTPFQLATDVAAVSASEAYTLYTKNDGSLWGTGYNAYGQFGNGGTVVTSSPVQIATGVLLAPEAPAGLTATPSVSFDRVRLLWTPQGSAASFEVWRHSINNSSSATMLASGVRWPVFEDRTVALGQAYYYWIKAVNPAGSTISAPANASTGASLSQTITFTGPLDQPYTSTPITLSATASSGLPVSFSLLSGPANLTGDQVTLTGVGTVTVRASQAGDAGFDPAPDVDRSFAVTANFDSWELGFFTTPELADANVSGPNADPDGDGYANLVEYALGLEPRTSSTAGLPEVTADATHWIYTYTRPEGRIDITITVEVSADLSGWAAPTVAEVHVSASGGFETWQAKQLLSSSNVFFRIKISQ